ncbi:DinB family protein [Pontimicrobium aquaticum]|uniref:DinB family protein n=1 Tax=Pontimicrobium aquaticum TaxID=2565367 RepID=A0A4U0F1T9_9FLAO|nr:DinB family protein [Pontimicrobium aquaticum]TJY38218.1 DinB family protein [Pontimicrobium aquaticum]
MKKIKFKTIPLIVFCLFVSNTTFSQINSEALIKAWDNMTNMVVETAEAMPSEYYSFKPTEELRDFTSQIGHTAGANYLFATVVKLERPDPSPLTDTKNKNQIIKELKESFMFIRNGMTKLTNEDLNEEIEFFGRKMSRLQSILIMTSHLQREHGKTTIYTRLKNIAPGKTNGW